MQDPMAVNQQIVSGDVHFTGPNIDANAKHLLKEIFQTEPNLRISLQDIMNHKFFVKD